MRYYEDFPVGLVNNFDYGYEFTEEEIISFATRWDPQPFHIDKDAAEKHIFGALTACSSHLIAVALSLGNDAEPTDAVSALGFSNMRPLLPAKAGDKVRTQEVVKAARLSNSHPGCGILTMECSLHNQRDELIFDYQSSFLIRCRPVEA